MASYGSRLFTNALSALNVNRAALSVASNNIANANNKEFSRQQIEFVTRADGSRAGQISIGNGVEIGAITRQVDDFINKVLRVSTESLKSVEVQNDFVKRVESLFDLTGETTTIGSSLNDFFEAVGNVANDPSNLEQRAVLIQKANALTTSINRTYNAIADLQTEADQRIASEIDAVNELTREIADLNNRIKQSEASGSVSLTDRDKRDNALLRLSEKISTVNTPNSDGTVTVTLPESGFAIVYGGTSRDLEVTSTPSFAVGNLPPSLSGGVLSHIVFDYGGGTHQDLTQEIKNNDGTLGGLTKLRGYNDPANTSAFDADGILVDIATRIESISRYLLTTVNQSYLGPNDEDTGTAIWDPTSADLNGNPPAVYGLFSAAGLSDVDANGLPDDLTAVAVGIDNYSSLLGVAFSDPARFAASLDLDAAAGSTSFTSGDGRNAETLYGLRLQSATFALGSYSGTGTVSDIYDQTVTAVGNYSISLESQYQTARDANQVAQNNRDEVSGVSMDEELAKVIQYQQAYNAAARLISIGKDLLDRVVELI